MNQDNFKKEFCCKVIEEINLLRKDPASYAAKIRKFAKYFKNQILKVPEQLPILTNEGAKAFKECADFLDKIDPVPILKQHPGLSLISEDVCDVIQKFEKVEEVDLIELEDHIDKYGFVYGNKKNIIKVHFVKQLILVQVFLSLSV